MRNGVTTPERPRPAKADGGASADDAVPVEAGGDDSPAQHPARIWTTGLEEGETRLARGGITNIATGLVGGIDVMLGVAAATVLAGSLSAVLPPKTAGVLGSFAFGIGFVFITIGRSELFTENFLVPVGAVIERRSRVRRLARLWGLTLGANVLGMFVMSAILSQRTVLDHNAVIAAGHTADIFASRTTSAAFLSAVAAGTLMTLWTWLSTAARTDVGRIMIAFLVGFALAAPTLNHVMVGTGEMMFGVLGGQAHVADWGAVGSNFVIALIGNLAGGTLFVTLTRFIQARGDTAASTA
jgi:formate-nitrite transporter family protein